LQLTFYYFPFLFLYISFVVMRIDGAEDNY
jgi:hypothetical protein